MNIQRELPLIKARAQALGARLDQLNRRIVEIQRRPATPRHIAVIDSERCLGCGLCETVCPAGAISIKGTAVVNASRCTGCGRCADECPQEAILLTDDSRRGYRCDIQFNDLRHFGRKHGR